MDTLGDVVLTGMLVLLFCLAAGLLFGIVLVLMGVISERRKE